MTYLSGRFGLTPLAMGPVLLLAGPWIGLVCTASGVVMTGWACGVVARELVGLAREWAEEAIR